MSAQPPAMTREAALRIGLAARALPGLAVSGLVHAIAGRLGLPLTEDKLSALTVEDLRALLAGDEAAELNCEVGFPMDSIKQAVRLLWGEGVAGSELPALDADPEAAIPGAIRVACASNTGEAIDGHFGSCERFLVYLVSATTTRLVALRPTLEADHADDRNLARATLIGDCQVLYVQSIGGPAAAKVIRAGVHPVKLGGQDGAAGPVRPAREVLAGLQRALASPPPWLAKVMGVQAASLEPYRALASAAEEM